MSSDYLKALDIGSGLNTSQIVDAIVNAEKVPKETRINNKIEARETQISSFSEIKSKLSSLQSNLSIYDGVNGLSLNKNGTSVTASITDKSKAGQFTHEIGVSSLAKAQTLEFDGFSSASASIGTGSLGFVFGTWSGSTFSANGTTGTVNITTGNDTLDGIAASINDASIGVSASVVQKTSTNYALVIKATTGASNAMQITATEDDISQNLDSISYTAYASDTQVVAGTDALLTIDGISVTRDSNTITDLVDGITLNLFATTSTNETIQATHDVEVALLGAKGFVAELNAVISLMQKLSSRGGESSEKGSLPGDPLVRSLMDQLKSLMNEPIAGFGEASVYLASFGVMTSRDGSVSLDETKFRTEYAADPDAFNAVLNSRVTTGSTFVTGKVTGSNYTAGSYPFTVSGNSATIDGSAMTFSNSQFSIASGNANGLTIEVAGGGTNTTIFMGQSLLDKVSAFVTDTLAFGNDIDERITNYNQDISEYSTQLSDFQTQIDALREKYVNQFAAKDAAIASLNGTKESLNMMMDGWRSMNS